MADAPKWMPARYSPSLTGTEEFPNHADQWLLALVNLVWRDPGGKPLQLDDWQVWLLRHLTEVYPEGHARAGELRFRQALVSMGRQNGKSVLGAILGLYGLVREAGSLVIGIASSVDQARIIYTRLLSVINGNKRLRRRFTRLTDTRGITSRDGSQAHLKASKSGALQGLSIDVGTFDELHLCAPALWSDMVNGTAARRNGVVYGLTTAGDDESELLLSLYQNTEAPGQRFGFWIWEAPEARVPDDEETLIEYLVAANPAIACGRLDVEVALSDLEGMPEPDVIRYRLNRFVSSSNSFLPTHLWAQCGTLEFPDPRPAVICVDRTPDWSHATITAAWKVGETTYTEVVASVASPTLDKLADLCADLSRHGPIQYVADGYTLKNLVEELKRRGMNAVAATQADQLASASLFYSKVSRRTLAHPGDALLSVQLPRAVRKNVGEQYRISRTDSTAEVDAVIATALGVYYAESAQDVGVQLFV